jgi:hypothetical protein
MAYTARENVEYTTPHTFEHLTDDDLLEKLLANWTAETKPALARTGSPVPLNEPRTAYRRPLENDDGVHPAVWRWGVQFLINGNTEILQYWPAELDAEPCSSDLTYLPMPEMVWDVAADGAVIVWIDALKSDDPTGVKVPREHVVAAAEYLDAFAAAANAEVAAYDIALRRELLEAIAERRARLGVIAEEMSEVVELLKVEARPLEIVKVADEGQPPASSPPADGAEPAELLLELKERTFADLIQVTSRWGTAVERYPGAFNRLDEETLTSLLVPTLNIAFDTAQREVFNRRGKTDIFVEAWRGKRDNAAFFGEAKIWAGQSKIARHLRQIFGYANARASEFMLLYYVKAIQLPQTIARCREGLEALSCFEAWVGDDDDLVAQVVHPRFEHSIKISLVFVHIPPEGAEPAEESSS